jgi:hypothetical protein
MRASQGVHENLRAEGCSWGSLMTRRASFVAAEASKCEHRRAAASMAGCGVPYRSDRDAEILREVLKILRDNGVGAKALLHQLDLSGRAPKNPNDRISRAALSEFINGRDSRKRIALAALWDFLRENYGTWFPDADNAAETLAAFSRFFGADAAGMASLREKFPGNYVMYRPDMRPIVDPLKPNGLVRASDVTISLHGPALSIMELQNFPETQYTPMHYQENSGALFPYGKFLLFIMRGDGGISFKSGVVDLWQSFTSRPIEWFRGRLFVASDLAIFPVVKFFCLRNSGTLSTGILPPEEVRHPEVSAYLRDVLKAS